MSTPDALVTAQQKRATLRELLSYGLPSMTGFLVLSLNELVDMFWLGRLGAESVAAVTVAVTLLWVLLEFPGFTIGAGSVAVISRRFGEGNILRTEQAIRATFLAKVILGIIFGGFGLLTMNRALALLGAEPSVLTLAGDFLIVFLITSPYLHASFSVFTVLRSIGKPKWAFAMQLIGVGVNMILDPLLIFGIGPFPRWGVFGAAMATCTSFLCVVIAGCYLLSSAKSPIRVRWFQRPFLLWPEIWAITIIGLPAGIASGSLALATTVAVRFVAVFGTDVVAIYGVGQKTLEFGLTAMAGFGLGGSALIGQYLGAKKSDIALAAGRLSVTVGFGAMLAYGLAIILLAPQIIAAFLPKISQPELGAELLRIVAIGLPLAGVMTGVETAFGGAGKNTPTMILSLIRTWVLLVPLMYLCGPYLGYGPAGLMWGRTIAIIVGGIAAWWLFKRGSWLKHEV